MGKDTVSSSDEMQLVTFVLDNETFGINIMNVQEIIRTPRITAVPQAPSYVEGVTNLRGNILPVLDVRTKFSMQHIESDVSNRVIVVDASGNKIGLSVDAVSEVLRVAGDRIESAPQAVRGTGQNVISGMVKVNGGKKLVMILDASAFSETEDKGNKDSAAQQNLQEIQKAKEQNIDEVQLVSFLLDKEEFAIEIECVNEIIRYPNIVKVPNVPDYIKGVISLRDSLLPILDLRVKLEIGFDEVTDNTRIVVIDAGDVHVGLVVDKVYEVTRITRDTIFPPPQTITGEARERIKGIARLNDGKRILMVIDAQNILSVDDIKDLEQHEGIDLAHGGNEEIPLESIDEEQMVVFKLGNEQFGVRIVQVQEINRLSTITKVPRAPRFVEGVVNLRGEVIPVIDLRKRFELEDKPYTGATRIIVSDINNNKIGIVVDEVMEVLRVSQNKLEESPEIFQENGIQKFMDGIANLEDRTIIMLNLENILVDKEWKSLENMGESETAKKKVTPKTKK